MVQVWLSLGSNIDASVHIRAAVASLRKQFHKLLVSPVYESSSVGFDGDNFLNLVVGIETDDSLDELKRICRRIEDENGRSREGQKFSSRTLDIDILTYGSEDLTAEGVNIPRDEITRYAFVLKPLADIAPDDRHPASGVSYADLWQQFDQSGQTLRVVELDFD